MLGKLLKHEFKSTYKVMITIFAIMTAVTLLGMAVFRLCDITSSTTPTSMVIVAIIYLVIYFISILAFMIISYVYLALHFYKTMYSAQGYLTHTLPVKPLTTFHVKSAVSVIWMLLVSILTALSTFGLIYSLMDPMIWEFISPDLFASFENIAFELYGLTMVEYTALIIVSMILSPILTMMMIGLACSIGQLFSRQKVAASIVTGIILYFVNQMINTAVSIPQLVETDLSDYSGIAANYGPTIWASLGISAAFALICYIGCNIIVRKHINLE